MTAWPIGGKIPDVLSNIRPVASRRGPVPAGPALSTDERRHVIGHRQAVAERASRRDPDGLLLRRQVWREARVQSMSRVELYAAIRRDSRVDGLSSRDLAGKYRVGRRTVALALSCMARAAEEASPAQVPSGPA